MASSDPRDPHRPPRADVHAAWIISLYSVMWTLLAGGGAIVAGADSGSTVLIAFGAVGFLDALGSAALAYHFRHALRHEAPAEHLERIAHWIIALGLLLVGAGAVIGGAARLINKPGSHASPLGIGLAAASVVVLILLSARKRALAARIPSRALRSDGHLSGVGAAQAAVTLGGSVTVLVGWWWADPVAATAVGLVTVALGVQSGRAIRGGR